MPTENKLSIAEEEDVSVALAFHDSLQRDFSDRTWCANRDVANVLRRENAHAYIASLSGVPTSLAFGIIEVWEDIGLVFHLRLIETHPQYWNRGIGSALLEHLQSTWERIALIPAVYGYKSDDPIPELSQRLSVFYERSDFVRDPRGHTFYWPRSEFVEILAARR